MAAPKTCYVLTCTQMDTLQSVVLLGSALTVWSSTVLSIHIQIETSWIGQDTLHKWAASYIALDYTDKLKCPIYT